MMERRSFITALGGAAAWPLLARAQQGDRVRRIGVLMGGDENDPGAKTYVSAFTQALAGLGWSDGRDVRIDLRWGRGDINRTRALAQELVGSQPDIILTNGTPATAALQRETRTIPIVVVLGDPVANGIIARLNLTSRAGTSPVSPPSRPRWEASTLSCSGRLRLGSSGPQSCSIPTRSRHRLICPHLKRQPGHSRSFPPRP